VLLLKDQWLLAQVQEIEGVELGDPDCILVEPLAIDGTDLKDWLPFADVKETVIRSSDILTFIEPGKELLSKYYAFKPIEPEVLTE
jgi:hypothetical protein